MLGAVLFARMAASAWTVRLRRCARHGEAVDERGGRGVGEPLPLRHRAPEAFMVTTPPVAR